MEVIGPVLHRPVPTRLGQLSNGDVFRFVHKENTPVNTSVKLYIAADERRTVDQVLTRAILASDGIVWWQSEQCEVIREPDYVLAHRSRLKPESEQEAT